MALDPKIAATLAQLNEQYASDRLPASARVTWGYDEGKGAYYTTDANGKKAYQSTTGMPSDTTASAKPDGGGLVHGSPQWDQKTGTWKTPIDWGKVGAWGVGGAIAAPYVAGALGVGAGASGAAAGVNSVASSIGAAEAAAGYGGTVAAGGGLTDLFLKYGLPVIGNVGGSIIQANQANKGLAAQQDYNNRALAAAQAELDYQHQQDQKKLDIDAADKAYTRNRYADFAKTLAPYQQTGATATQTASGALAGGWQPGQSANEPMVMLRAPNGHTKSVPQSQVGHYTQLGAVPING